MSAVALGDELFLLHKSSWICHLTGDFLECVTVSVAKSIGMVIISPFSSAGQQQQCQCRNSLTSQCSSSSAGLPGRIKTQEEKRVFHPSGKGQKVRWEQQTQLRLYSQGWGKMLKGSGNGECWAEANSRAAESEEQRQLLM